MIPLENCDNRFLNQLLIEKYVISNFTYYTLKLHIADNIVMLSAMCTNRQNDLL